LPQGAHGAYTQRDAYETGTKQTSRNIISKQISNARHEQLLNLPPTQTHITSSGDTVSVSHSNVDAWQVEFRGG